MHPQFAVLTPHWFKRAYVYTGSIGEFRYRFKRGKGDDPLQVAVYTSLCYEAAVDVEEREFPLTDEGVEEVKAWLQEKYEAYCQK